MGRGARVILGSLFVWALFVAVFLLDVLYWQPNHCLEFTSPRLNTLTGVVILILPALSLPWLFTLRRGWSRVLAAAVLVPIALSSLFLAFLVGWNSVEIKTDKNPDFQLVRTIPVDGPPVRVYVESAMLSDDGILIQQERTVLPGLVWVTQLLEEDEARDVEITVLDRHHIRCTFQPEDSDKGTHTVVLQTR
jgi:hypothetical protein